MLAIDNVFSLRYRSGPDAHKLELPLLHVSEPVGASRLIMKSSVKLAIHEYKIVGDVMVSFAMDGRMAEGSMEAMYEEIRNKPITKFLGTDTGGVEVTSVQRAVGAEVVREKGVKVAVVTDERLMRGIVTALSWLGANIKSFDWNNVKEAIKYLQVDPKLEDDVFNTALALKRSCEAKAKLRDRQRA